MVYEINDREDWQEYVGIIQWVLPRIVPPRLYRGEVNIVAFYTKSALTQAIGFNNNPYIHLMSVPHQEYQGQSGVWRFPGETFPPAPTE